MDMNVNVDFVQTASVIITVLGSAYLIHRDISADMKVQSSRTDKLYEMFIDLLKEGRSK